MKADEEGCLEAEVNMIQAKATVYFPPSSISDDWMLHPMLFKEVSDLWNKTRVPLQVDVAASSTNTQLPSYLDKETNFMKAGKIVQGKALYCNPPFRQITQFVNRFVELKSQDANTSMMLITPYTTNSPWWALVNKHFKLARVIPNNWRAEGSSKGEGKIFTRPITRSKQGENNLRVYPCEYDTSREYTRSAFTDICVWFSNPTHHFVKNVSYYEPNKEYSTLARLTTLSGNIQGQQLSVLVDTGAQVNMISQRLIEKLGLPVTPSNIALKWVDNTQKQATMKLENLDVLLNGQSFTITDVVSCDLATYDLIVGVPFLDQTEAILSHRGNRTITLYNNKGEEVQLYSTSHRSQDNEIFIGYAAAQQEVVHKKASLFLLHVQASDTTESVSFESCIDESCSPQIKQQLLQLLNKYKSVFQQPDLANMNPKCITIKLKNQATPYSSTPYKLNENELIALKNILEQWLAKGWIKPGYGPWGAPILLLRKKSGAYRLVCDYRGLNDRVVSESWPLPRIDSVLENIRGATTFSKMDLASGYHQLRLDSKAQPYTAFITPIGQFVWTVLPQGLKTAPSLFSKHLDEIFTPIKHERIASNYLDDVLVHTSLDAHLAALERVFKLMQDNQLYADLSKCKFHAKQVDFLGHECSEAGVGPEKNKVSAISQWPVPQSFEEAHKFLGLCAWFRRHIPKFSEVAEGLQSVVNKKHKCSFSEAWDDAALTSFNTLKEYMTSTATVMKPFEYGLPTCIWTDSSEYAVGAILFQQSDSLWYPIAYLSNRLNQSQLHWIITEKELYAIIVALEAWSHYLRGHPRVLICTDHKALVIKPSTKPATLRVTRWLSKMAQYDYIIVHKPGIVNMLADSLSRRPDYLSWFQMYIKSSPSIHLTHQDACVQTDSEVLANATIITSPAQTMNVLVAAFPPQLLAALEKAYSDFDPASVSVPLKLHANLWYTAADQIYLPDLETQLLAINHVHTSYFHSGVTKTYKAVQRMFWFPNMKNVVSDTIQGCQVCQQVKAVKRRNTTKGSIVQQVAQSGKKLSSIMIDFIWGLPACQGFTGILSVVDLFSKLCHAIPVKQSVTSEQTAQLLIKHWVTHYGVPTQVFSDQDIRFVSESWKSILAHFHSTAKLSSPYHPQSQGAIEVLNGVITDCLRAAMLEMHTHNWVDLLPWVTYSLNSLSHTAHGLSPHEIVFGCTFPLIPNHDTDLTTSSVMTDLQLSQLTELCKTKLLSNSLEQQPTDPWQPASGESVWLSTKFLKFKQGAGKKLLPRYIGPFKVLESYGHSAKLDLPSYMMCRRTWNVIYLKKFVPNTSGFARIASDWQIGPSDVVEEDQSALDPPPPDPVSEMVVTDLHFHKSTRKGRLFRVQFNNDWNISAYHLEHDLASLANGLNVHKAWLAAHQRRGE